MPKLLCRRLLCAAILLLTTGPAAAQQQPQLTVADIMRDPGWIGHSPENPYWSEDGKLVYFYWNPEDADADSLYRTSRNGGAVEKISLAEQERLPAPGGDYSRDYRSKVFSRDGDVYHYDLRRQQLTRITRTQARESDPSFSQDETRVFFRSGSSLNAWIIATGVQEEIAVFKSGKRPDPEPEPKTDIEKYLRREELRLISTLKARQDKRDRHRRAQEAHRDGPAEYYLDDDRPGDMSLSPDGRYVAVRVLAKHDDKETFVPSYVENSGFTRDITARSKVGSPQQKSRFAVGDLKQDSLIYVRTDSLPGIALRQELADSDTSKSKKSRDVDIFGPYWNPQGNRAYVEVRSADNKDRWLAMLDPASGRLTTFEHQSDSAWVGGPNISGWNFPGTTGWTRDGRQVWFCSEETGYSHLYTFDVASRKRVSLTQGAFEIYDPMLSRDGKHWFFGANAVHPGERHYYRMAFAGGPLEKLTSLPGYNEAQLSFDEKRLLIRHSYMNKPWELYVQEAKPGKAAKQLTHSTTENWRRYPWRIPEIVRVPAADGALPYARLYRPDGANGAAVIFVHGAGYLQNAHKWWSSYFREYMFHNLLADRGYTVLDIDYRGSAGYGRDWRTAIYRHIGGKDLDDQVDGARYLIAEHGIDAERIGIYGGSYGGFITLMAMFTKPGVFRAGAALRSVTDWAHYNHPYTSNILNQPQDDSLAFRRSSPIYFAEGLKGDLLICHGMIDTNVHFQDVVRLTQRLIELGKENWELAVYPLEGHGFVEPESWTDEYRRVLHLFERTLR